MKIPSLKLQAFRVPDLVTRWAGRGIELLKAQKPGTLAAGGAVLFFLTMALLLGSTEGSAPSEDSSTVIKLNAPEATHPAHGKNQGQAVSLIAANGVVISEPALIELSPDGPLPKIAPDGRKPMTVYARPVDATDPRPKVALTLTGLGMSESLTQQAIDSLSPGITLGFSPYGSSLQGMVSAARAKGHEVVLEVPLEPYDYPNNDPGQNTLLAEAPWKDNSGRLHWVMSRFTGYAGLINSQGSKYLASMQDTGLLMAHTSERGLYFLDSAQADPSRAYDASRLSATAFARADMAVDQTPGKDAIDAELLKLESLAQSKGKAIGLAFAYPVTVERIQAWSLTLEQKGLALVPVSALVVTEKAPVRPAAHAPSSSSHGTAKPARGGHSKPTSHAPEHEEAGPHP